MLKRLGLILISTGCALGGASEARAASACDLVGTDFASCGTGKICASTPKGAACRACGSLGQPCCPGAKGGGTCGAGASCYNWTRAASSGTVSDAGSCVGCGKTGQPCCSGKQQCSAQGDFCLAGRCTACGSMMGHRCCPSPMTPCQNGWTCAGNNTCRQAVTATCGQAGQACCPTGPACAKGLSCNELGDGACN